MKIKLQTINRRINGYAKRCTLGIYGQDVTKSLQLSALKLT